ncbi:tautomerase family protein [Schinkia azotoformans]|uniref:4-oxalocrotonate tautomerase DmpI n=1 Tax=Schinkia azotoformans TaxID=1454 RepID=UPI002E2260D2|nr:4-oxalocrotonate tautomerase DmpI [Schinkia azotoformans]MED4354979.1 tautomerase family protein [Schinkia azotoformans]
MPIIKLDSGKLTDAQIKELILKLTQTASEITNIPKEFFMVVINEHDDKNFGIGGQDIAEVKKNYKA